VAAIVLLVSLLYHISHLVIVQRDRVILRLLMPAWRDVRDLSGTVRYRLGLTTEYPQPGTFNYSEKIEYWAFIWGTVVMAVSGFLLWFNNLSLRFLPKWASDAATMLHFYEAILATAAIVVWHFYLVIFDPEVYPMDRAWLTGKTTAHPRQPSTKSGHPPQ
jgi:cytochrome b subunit of formate dehydrogenase